MAKYIIVTWWQVTFGLWGAWMPPDFVTHGVNTLHVIEGDLLADEVAETSAPLVWISQRRGGIPKKKKKKEKDYTYKCQPDIWKVFNAWENVIGHDRYWRRRSWWCLGVSRKKMTAVGSSTNRQETLVGTFWLKNWSWSRSRSAAAARRQRKWQM